MRKVLALLTVAIALWLAATPVGAASLKSRLLSVTDLPTGWSQTHTSGSGGGVTSSHCFSPLKNPVKHGKTAKVAFKSTTTTILLESLATGKGEVARLRLLNRYLRGCHGLTLTSHGKTVHFSVGRMSFPKVSRTSNTFSMMASVTGFQLGFDVVTFRAGRLVGAIMFGGLGTPSISTVVSFAREAVAKAEGKHVSPPATAPSTG